MTESGYATYGATTCGPDLDGVTTVQPDATATDVPLADSSVGSTPATGCERRSVVPDDFKEACDVVFSALSYDAGTLSFDVAMAAWVRYGAPQRVMKNTLRIVAANANGHHLMGKEAFALGCYLLASWKRDRMHSYCSVREFIGSGFALSRDFEKICCTNYLSYFRFLCLLLVFNALLTILSQYSWNLEPLALITSAISCYVFNFSRKYTFLLNTPLFARLMLLTGLIVGVFSIGAFVGVGFSNPDTPFADMWSLYFPVTLTYKMAYLVLSCTVLVIMISHLRSYHLGTAMVLVPTVDNELPPRPSNILLCLGCVVCGIGAATILGLFLLDFPTQGAMTHRLSTVVVWSLVVPAGLMTMAITIELIVRTSTRPMLKVLSILLGSLEILSPFYCY